MNELVEISNDLFDIASRLRSVNPNYVVYYNKRLQRFEVHDNQQRPTTLAFVVPFEELDARTVDYALFTKVENAKALFEEMEKHNEALDKIHGEKAVEQALNVLKECI